VAFKKGKRSSTWYSAPSRQAITQALGYMAH